MSLQSNRWCSVFPSLNIQHVIRYSNFIVIGAFSVIRYPHSFFPHFCLASPHTDATAKGIFSILLGEIHLNWMKSGEKRAKLNEKPFHSKRIVYILNWWNWPTIIKLCTWHFMWLGENEINGDKMKTKWNEEIDMIRWEYRMVGELQSFFLSFFSFHPFCLV